MLGAAATCPDQEIGPDPDWVGTDCWEVTQSGTCLIENREFPGTTIPGWYEPVKKIISVEPGRLSEGSPPNSTTFATLELPSGRIVTGSSGAWPPDIARWYLVPDEGSECIEGGGGGQPVNPPVPDHIYVDETTNCNYTVKFEGFIRQTPLGPIQPVWQIEGGQQLRAGGGRIGGCNLSPTIYVSPPNGPGGPGGPPIPPIPLPPGPLPDPIDGVPWWAAPLLAGSTSAALSLIGNALNDLLGPKLPAGSYTLTAPCDVDEEGNPQTRTWQYPDQKVDERLLAHQITILEALQQHLDWKTPICQHDPFTAEGVFRTISFRSDQTSPYGKSRLRKRFRYRCLSGNDENALVDHWKDFSFEGGPHRVRWTGPTWRSPEVWAATPAEGKRVVQHAADEAGVGPLEAGGWSTRLSGSGRQGVPGTMRVDTTGGYYWITARDGSDARPKVAEVPASDSGVDTTNSN